MGPSQQGSGMTKRTLLPCSAICQHQSPAMIALRPGGFHAGLVGVVAVVTKRLPVIDAPEQNHIPPVRDYVIDQRCQQRASVAEIDAPRV